MRKLSVVPMWLTALMLGVALAGRRPAQAKYPTQTDRGRRALRARRRHRQPHADDRGHHRREQVVAGAASTWSTAPGGSGAVGYTYLIGKKGDPTWWRGHPTSSRGKIEGRLPGDHRDAMTILMIVAIDELMLSVRAESPYQTVEEFVKAAEDKPGQLTVGGTGTNTEDHIFTYLFEKAAGIKVKYVPFNSGGEVTAALMGGHVDAAVENPNEIVAQIEAKKARNLAVAAASG